MTYARQLRSDDMLCLFGEGEGALTPGDIFGLNILMPGRVSPAYFSPTPSANPGFSINQQVVDEPASTLVSALLNLQTRRALVKYNRRINRRSQIMRALTLRELLRYEFAGCSIRGSID